MDEVKDVLFSEPHVRFAEKGRIEGENLYVAYGQTMSKKQIDPIPDEFDSYEQAAEFWDTHSTTDYPDAFHTVEIEAELRKRHYEVEIEEKIVRQLQMQARRKGVTVSRLASDLLRQQLVAIG